MVLDGGELSLQFWKLVCKDKIHTGENLGSLNAGYFLTLPPQRFLDSSSISRPPIASDFVSSRGETCRSSLHRPHSLADFSC